ncbi:Glyoxylase, beta-lactamase superfamily II [Haloarcula vallismortis]|uniref:Beta-lactamase domain-containing protein n=2 Tax=Haloarcula vallismortis TaxID=28442 RepID=M0JQG1_HALVA|nr:MBL fold metallo-hydrolase [Haloarcula vallismortis]EMA11372.1 beta-lactamase domain-containing protein [Haloarcula vallismortis ATCC 29715]SDW39333.1 Glyoxylase, beta-lactamase superfamily II [Haloarcula vallismortis]
MADGYPDPPTDPPSLSAAALQSKLDTGESVRLLDVRDRNEYEQWRIRGESVTTTQLPFTKFLQAKVTGEVDDVVADVAGTGPITVVCGRGEASAFVAGLLTEHGFEAQNLSDGMEGWARLYEAREVPCDATTVLQYRRRSSGCLGYMIVSDGSAAVVDPLRAFTDRYVTDAADRDASLTYAIDTHVHADHVSGVRRLAAETDAEAMLSERAVARGVDDVTELADGETLRVGSATLEAHPLPGHTTGMTGFTIGDVLLAGDSVFLDSVARPDLEAGADGARDLAQDLHRTLTDRLAALPDETLVAPGHYSESTTPATDGTFTATLATLRDRLPAFEMDRDAFVEYVCDDMPPRPANFEQIIAINLGTEAADDDTAFELELGPNNCAAAPSDAV